MSQKLDACIWYQRKGASNRQPATSLSQLCCSRQEHRHWHHYENHLGQEKHFVICSSTPHPTQLFCKIWKGEVLHQFPESFWGCFYYLLSFTFSSDGHRRLQPLGCIMQKTFSPLRALMPRASNRHHPACTPFSRGQRYSSLGEQLKKRLKQPASSIKSKALKPLPGITAKWRYPQPCSDSSPSAESIEVGPHPCLGNGWDLILSF